MSKSDSCVATAPLELVEEAHEAMRKRDFTFASAYFSAKTSIVVQYAFVERR